jgi:mannose-6-phosphate isomerase-like protein (cupin superfamily)
MITSSWSSSSRESSCGTSTTTPTTSYWSSKGRLTIQLRDRQIELQEGEMFVVPRGVEHCPKAEREAHVLLIEPGGTRNTGDAGGSLTVDEREI